MQNEEQTVQVQETNEKDIYFGIPYKFPIKI